MDISEADHFLGKPIMDHVEIHFIVQLGLLHILLIILTSDILVTEC